MNDLKRLCKNDQQRGGGGVLYRFVIPSMFEKRVFLMLAQPEVVPALPEYPLHGIE